MFNRVWRLPAQLLRRRSKDVADGDFGVQLIKEGSLEEMVRSAESAGPTEASLLLIRSEGSSEPLTWPDIKKLRASPDFPVEI